MKNLLYQLAYETPNKFIEREDNDLGVKIVCQNTFFHLHTILMKKYINI